MAMNSFSFYNNVKVCGNENWLRLGELCLISCHLLFILYFLKYNQKIVKKAHPTKN